MIKTIITLTIAWVIIAFAWDPFVSIVDKTQAVDKTKKLVNIYTIMSQVKKRNKMSTKILIYSKPNCVYCDKSKHLVKSLGLQYEEKMFGKDFTTPDQLYEAVGKQVRTMPQIIIDDKHIGGYNELVEYFADKGLVNFKGEKV